jgi:hypothetical protein
MSIPTAEELGSTVYQPIGMSCNEFAIKLAIEFAKLHVEAALEAASETEIVSGTSYKHRTNLDMDIIMNSYPLEKIK